MSEKNEGKIRIKEVIEMRGLALARSSRWMLELSTAMTAAVIGLMIWDKTGV